MEIYPIGLIYQIGITNYESVVLDQIYTHMRLNYLRGIANYELRQYREAIKDFDKAIEIYPIGLTYQRGFVRTKFGQYKKATKDFDEARSYYDRGCAKCSLGQYREAIEYFNKAIDTNQQLSEDRYQKKLAKNRLKHYKKVITKKYYNRGLAKVRLRQYKEAVEDFDKAIEINPQLVIAYNDRGSAKYKLGQYKEATWDFYSYMRKRLQTLIK